MGDSISTTAPDSPSTAPVPSVPSTLPTVSDSNWIISIREELSLARQREEQSTAGVEACIYRVPQNLRGGGREEKAYLPQVVSIGPYHHNRQQLYHMEVHKKQALNQMLTRNSEDVKIYLDAIKELEQKARRCYDEEIKLGSNEFVLMMLLDGCFLLEIIRGAVDGFTQLGYSPEDPVFALYGVMNSIPRDMILLENQIPFFILNRIWDQQSNKPRRIGLIEFCLQFFKKFNLTDDQLRNESTRVFNFDPSTYDGALHCLDICRRSFLFTVNTIPRTPQNLVVYKKRQQLTHSVTELRAAGVRFEKRMTNRLWDIEFENRVLKIPPLPIDDRSKYLFMNLIAYEQCHPLNDNHIITTYLMFMDSLIDTSEDVDHLQKCGIIKHWLGNDDEVAELFNTMGKDVKVNVDGNELLDLSTKLNQYCDNKWHEWLAMLKNNYFSSPWAVLSLIGAIVLLLLTSLQTFYTVYVHYQDQK